MTRAGSIISWRSDKPVAFTRAGFSLVEVVISVIVLSVLTAGALNLIGGAARARQVQSDQGKGVALAQDLLSEVMHRAYSDPDTSTDPPVEGNQTTLSSSGGASTYNVTTTGWIAQSIQPNLPADAISWKITRVDLNVQKRGSATDEFRVQLRAATAGGEPGQTVLASTTFKCSQLPTGWHWLQITYNRDGLTPGMGVFVIVEGVSGAGDIVEVAYAGTGSGGMFDTTDEGETWNALAPATLAHYVYGTTTAASGGSSSPIGIDAGETGADRATFDDVDDYHGWQKSPPEAADGTTIPGATGWTREVTVERASPIDFSTAGSETGLKRITVKVTGPSGKITELTSLRSRAGPSDVVDSQRDFVGRYAAEIQPRLESVSRLHTGVAHLNEPTSSTQLLINGKFESDTSPWYAIPDSGNNPTATLTHKTAGGHDGGPYLRVTGRQFGWSGPAQDVTNLIESGVTYQLSGYLNSSGLLPDTLTIGIRVNSTGSGDQYYRVNAVAPLLGWGFISGNVTPTWSGDLNFAYVYVSSWTGDTGTIQVDDLKLIQP